MFLEKITINGFKSFANSLEIEFDAPLTAIVGPNGSGKSNIVDAVRWVLGEQSAKSLRGTRMADVIFAGSEGHNPCQKATVTLHLNNENSYLPLDMEHLSLSRTVNIDGYSDYFLNGSSCRLKDIENLLMDTGLGKNSYSIVSQGQISSIINSRPEKLRELFEESAGISKHKARKAATEKKLAANRKDLQRIADLIVELKKQLPGLKREAEKAKQYRQYYGELQTLEINLLHNKWQQQQKELGELKQDFKTFSDQLSEQEDTFSCLQNKLAQKKDDLETKEQKYRQLKDDFYSLQSQKEETGNKIEVILEKKKALQREKEVKEEQVAELKESVDKGQQQQRDLLQAVSSLQEERKQLQQELSTQQEKVDDLTREINLSREKIATLREEIYQTGELNQLKTQKTRIVENINHQQHSLREQFAEYLQFARQRRQQQQEGKKLLETAIKQKQTMESIKREIEEKNGQRLQLNNRINQLRENYEDVKERYRNINSRLEVLEDREKNYSGFYQGVKNILQNQKQFPEVVDAVVNLLTVDKKLERATARVLGSRLQNIVVKTDRGARNCINYLKENEAGQATFLPLNIINPRWKSKKDGKVYDLDGFIGFGNELIATASEYKKLLLYLLGGIIYARDLKSAIAISKQITESYKIVSLEGEVINPGGAITGGSSRSREHQFLQREREIKKLQRLADEKNTDRKALARELEQLKQERTEYKQKINQKSKKMRELELKLNKNRSKLENYQEDARKRMQRGQQYIQTATKELKNIVTLKTEKTDLEKNIRRADDQFELEKKKIASEEEKVNIKEQHLQEIKEQMTDLKVKIAAREQKITDHKQKKTETQLAVKENKDKIESYQQRSVEIKQLQKQYREQIQELRSQRQKFSRQCLEVDQKLEELEEELARDKNKVKQLEKEVQPAREQLERYQEDLHKLELKINRLKNSQQRITEKLQEEYGFITGEDTPQEAVAIDSRTKAEKKIKNLKRKIRSLHPVNEGAVSDYTELKNRVDYLEEQRQDLQEARQSLQKIITEIENNMSQLFYKSYQQVKKEFESIFQELFEGGRAELKLTAEDNLLETGVEIEAQPPGKQLKELSLLSGGERALTAIALVFAFLNVNPSPLYILDEIDAPLDDVNLVKFANFIERYSAVAQFIIITHRKQMMSRVETLYGVTMEEKGISRVISLKLEEEGAEFVKN